MPGFDAQFDSDDALHCDSVFRGTNRLLGPELQAVIMPALGYAVVLRIALIDLLGSQSEGGKLRVMPGSVALLCRWPQVKQIAPTARMSVSFEISFSRTAIDPVTTGPAHWSQE
jgi:hypothetical protein